MFYHLLRGVCLFTLLTLFAPSTRAQSYQPILEPNAVWTQGVVGAYFSPLVTYNYEKLSLVGDTLINGIAYQKMYRSADESTFDASTATYAFAIREEDNGEVWVFPPFSSQEVLYMDFGLEVGETSTVYTKKNFTIVGPISNDIVNIMISEKDSILIADEWRTRLLVEVGPFCYTEYWIEGIGNTGGFLRNITPCLIPDTGWQGVICHELNGSVDYQAVGINSCTTPYPLSIIGNPFEEQTICVGQTAIMSDPIYLNLINGGTEPYTFSVTPYIGVENVGHSGVFVSPTETTTYTFTATDLFGASISVDFTVNVLDTPIDPVDILVSNFTDECYVDSLLLSASGVYDTYQWTNLSGDVLGNNPTLVIEESATHYLEVSNEVGCTESTSEFFFNQPLNFNPIPEIIFNPSPPCEGDIVTVSTKESYTSYLWSTGETTPTIQVPVQVGMYNSVSVQVTNELGCIGPDIINPGVFFGNPYPNAAPNIILEDGVLIAEINEDIEFYQWFLNGEAIGGASGAFLNAETVTSEAYFVPTESGSYSIAVGTVGYELACSFFSESIYVDISGRPLELTVILEGPYDPSTGLMDTDLLDAGLLPNSQPYNVAPWNHNGGESVDMIPENTVDWVLVEARSGALDLTSPSTTVIETQAAFLLSDGSIVSLSGETLQFYNLGDGADYHIAIRHRNHLDIISATPSTSNATIFHDFSLSTNEAFGPEQLKEMSDGKFAMFAADFDPNGVILNTDYDDWTAEPALNQVYNLTDANLDGVVQATDYDLWFINRSKLGVVEIQY